MVAAQISFAKVEETKLNERAKYDKWIRVFDFVGTFLMGPGFIYWACTDIIGLFVILR